MSVTSGFFNSTNHDRKYDARQFSSLFDGIITDGVFAAIGSALAVTAIGTNMQVRVGTGKAWFNRTWTDNDSILSLTVEAAHVAYNRIDAVVLEVNEDAAVRANSIKIVKGVASSSPQRPTMVDTATVHQHALAYISVKVGATSIKNADITNVIGTSETPVVTGPLESMDIEFFVAKMQEKFDSWFGEITAQLSGNVATNLQNQINDRVKIGDISKYNRASYQAFASGDIAEIDAAFGMNNEDKTIGLGLALAMYAKLKDPTIDIETQFANLIQCDNLQDITGIDNVRSIFNVVFKPFVSSHTTEITIDQQMINGSKKIYATAYAITMDNASTYQRVNVTLNSVDISFVGNNGDGTAKGVAREFNKEINLSSCNITSPGVYPLEIKASTSSYLYVNIISVG